MLLNTITIGAEFQPRAPINRAWIVKGTGSNRPAATEGVDFTLTETDTKFVALRNQYMAFNFLPRYVAGVTKKLYMRFYVGLSTQVAVWGNGNAFSRWFGAGWQRQREASLRERRAAHSERFDDRHWVLRAQQHRQVRDRRGAARKSVA